MLLLSTSCRSDAGSNPGSPADELRAAARATASLPSFRVTAALIQDGSEAGGTTIDFRSPDQFVLTLERDRGPVIIVVGKSAYFAAGDREGFFEERPTPEGALDSYPLFALNIISSARDVTREGDRYVFVGAMSDGGSSIVSGKAWLAGGLVVKAEISLPGAGVSQPLRFEFSRFGSDINVTAPSMEHLLPPGAGLPSCGPQGSPPPGTSICFPDLSSSSASAEG